MKVLKGLDGYLFLSNDTNRSVDQYTGEYLIPATELGCWDEYLDALRTIRQERQTEVVFLVAPSKEYIFPEYYPFPPSDKSPITQLVEKFTCIGERLVYPLDELKACREISYVKGDTHWTDYGGMIAAEAVLKALGIVFEFSTGMPKFSLLSVAGDLGSTIAPALRYPSYYAEFDAAGISASFDNGIDNHGRIWTFTREDAPGGTALVFGDSFSKNLVPWLNLVFKRLVYVHSAGSIDSAMLALERPDVVILQTNNRFLVKAPRADLSTKSVIEKKVTTLSEVARNALIASLHAQPEEQYKAWMLDLLHIAGAA